MAWHHFGSGEVSLDGVAVVQGEAFVLVPGPVPEWVCEDCMEGDHEACRRNGGWPFQETDERCGCHLTEHRLDNRQQS